MYKSRAKVSFVAGFVAGALLSGAALVYSGVYQPKKDGAWIRDASNYSDATDQINVLGDIAPGGGVLMMEIGLRLNALNFAGKKKKWDLAGYQAHEMEEAFEKLEVTRPSLESSISSFLATSFKALENAINARSKGQFKSAMKSMISGCNGCHVNNGHPEIRVKLGKSALPLK